VPVLIYALTLLTRMQLLATQNLVYFWSVGLMRLAVVAFLPRLGKDSKLLSTNKVDIIVSRSVKQ
jgi:hypothetical protein